MAEYRLGETAARQIAEAVRVTSGLPDGVGGPLGGGKTGKPNSKGGFFARITGESDTEGLYDWVRMMPNPADETRYIEYDESSVIGEGSAFEINDSIVRIGSIHWMSLNGFNTEGEARFRFHVGGNGNGFWATLGGATLIEPNRWSYPFAEAKYAKEGTYTPANDNPITGNARNSMEANNTESGKQGNGVRIEDLAEGLELGPVDGAGVVWMRQEINCDTLENEYIFSAENPVVGSCQ